MEDLYQTIDKLREGINKKENIALFARCIINYDGRAESFLDEGERIILIKSDGTILIHQPTGSAPINYMKENNSINLFPHERGILLSAKNAVSKEILDIQLIHVHSMISHSLEDLQKIALVGTEKDMVDLLYNNPEMIEKGFKPLSMEEHTKYGFIDLFGHDKDNVLVVIECKRYKGDLSAVQQLRRYVEKIKKSKGLEKVRGILACPTISDNAKSMLEDWGFSFIKVEPPKYFEKQSKEQKRITTFFN